ncbi:hypothetical protein [Enhygromyxa salina]|uniref:hypothetical protein n=1 Tax=Enhygromyxa salina TaxID=215803 RepID=UPI0011B1E468|nr:hypothetical protein [Enhygromyxa salina]
MFIRDSLEFMRQFGACTTTGRAGLAEEVGKVFVGLGSCAGPQRGTVQQGKEPRTHEFHAIKAIGLVFWQSWDLLPDPETHAPEGEDDQGDRTDDANPRKYAFSAR